MKKLLIILSIFHFAFLILNSSAAVPLKWTVETSRLHPAVFDVVRGETLALEASFQSYGKPVSTSNMTAFLCWQTNGMESAWWMTNACTAAALSGSQSNVARVLFTPEMDPGAQTVNAFLGLSDSTNQLPTTSYQLPSLSYRAAFTLRFRHGPGQTPNALEGPVRVLDLEHTTVINPPWPTKQDFAETTTVMRAEMKTYIDGQITEAGLVTPTMTTNISACVTSNVVTKAYVEGLGIESGLDTNAVKEISSSDMVTNQGAVAVAQAMTNNITFEQLKEKPTTLEGYGITDGAAVYNSLGGYMTYWYLNEETSRNELDVAMKDETVWIDPSKIALENYNNTWSEEQHFIHGAKVSYYFTEEMEDETVANYKLVKDTVEEATNDFITAQTATNAAEAVFGSKGPSDIGAYPNASGQQLATQVATQGAHLNAEDAQFISTNYDSNAKIPEAYVRIKLQQGGTNVWRTIWEEMRRWNAFTGSGFNWQTWGGFHTWSTNILAMIEETSPKEYAFYDGTTGDVAPDGFFWISQPRIGICAGAGYQRYLDSGGAVWILESNGLVANIGGTTNGYFRISDEEGNTQFEIIKGDKQTVPAIARSMRSETVMGVTHWICDYAVTNAVAPPVAKFCRNLGANPPVWIADTEASCPCNVTWTPGVNTYTLEFWPKSTEPTMFCKAEYDRGGDTRIRQAVPTEMQYIILNGTKYGLVPKTVNGELVMGLTTGN